MGDEMFQLRKRPSVVLAESAPSLLSALEMLTDAVCPDGDIESLESYFRGPVANAFIAIAKAKGETPSTPNS